MDGGRSDMFVVKSLPGRTSTGRVRGDAAVRGRDLVVVFRMKVVVMVMLKGSVSVCGGDGGGMGVLARSQSRPVDGESHDERWKAGGATGRRRGCGR